MFPAPIPALRGAKSCDLTHGYADSIAEIAEALAHFTLEGESFEQRSNRRNEFAARYQIRILGVQTSAFPVAADVDDVLVQRATNESEVGGVGPRAAIGATRHAHGERHVREAEKF